MRCCSNRCLEWRRDLTSSGVISALPLRSWPDAPVADAPALSPQGCRALPPGPAAPDGPAPAPADRVSHGRASVGPCTVRLLTLLMCITPLQPTSNRPLQQEQRFLWDGWPNKRLFCSFLKAHHSPSYCFNSNQTSGFFSIRTLVSLLLLHMTFTCAFQTPGCLMSHSES